MELFCLKQLPASPQGQPVLQAVTFAASEAPVLTGREEKPYPALTEHTRTPFALATVPWYKSFRLLCLYILSAMTSLDQKHYHANFFLSGKAIGQCNPGGFLRGPLNIRVHGAIHDFWQP